MFAAASAPPSLTRVREIGGGWTGGWVGWWVGWLVCVGGWVCGWVQMCAVACAWEWDPGTRGQSLGAVLVACTCWRVVLR